MMNMTVPATQTAQTVTRNNDSKQKTEEKKDTNRVVEEDTPLPVLKLTNA